MEEIKLEESKFEGIEYANLYQSLHIGCMDYGGINEKEFPKIEKSYEDVKKYEDFFTKELKFEKEYV
jgi:hypothetical protein